MNTKLTPLLLALAASFALSACAVGPDYDRPTLQASSLAFKEGQNWKPAEPRELAANGRWWEMFGDVSNK